jgi:hypothetical protein
LHLILFEPQGIFLRMTWPPTHSFDTGTEQGGQSPKWQLWEPEWPHGWGTEHGSWHKGGIVPQGRGGGIEVLPQAHVKSEKIVSRHGGQWPLWHNVSHTCWPHLSFFPQSMEQKWGSQSAIVKFLFGPDNGQHFSLHRCLPQFFFAPQGFSQVNFWFSINVL